MLNEYPKMLVKKGGDVQFQDGLYETRTVETPEEEDVARNDGFAPYSEAAAATKSKTWK